MDLLDEGLKVWWKRHSGKFPINTYNTKLPSVFNLIQVYIYDVNKSEWRAHLEAMDWATNWSVPASEKS